MSTQPDPLVVKLLNVRLSYAHLFEAVTFQGEGKPAFSATFLMDKKTNAAEIKKVEAAIAFAVREGLKGKRPPPEKLCFRDGSTKPDTDGYHDGMMFVGARNDKRPGVVDRDLTPLTAQDGKPYSGCYVNATVRFWAQDNKWGKRVNCSLRNVQFVKDGEPFGEKPVAAEEDFDAIEENADSAI